MDIISGLPDELLVKILLLVPTKVAVSTSILSKRWEYLWMWLPKLDYGPRNCSECEKLRCFLNRNLPLHRAPVLESFRLDLCCSRFKPPENINMWIGIAVSHCLRELEMMLYESDPAKPFVLPSNLYACKSLVVGGDILLDVPTMASLPSLKTMKLQSVRYFSDKTLPLLLSKCPVLEDLVVDLREDDTPRYLGVSVPSLQSLSLYIPYNNHIIDGFVLVTPALKYFKLMDYNEHYCLIESMPNLIEAYLDVDCPDIKDLIGSITSVKRLSICSKDMLDEGFVFNQLEHLEVCLCMEHSSNQLFRLLKASSNLKRLDISLMRGHVSQGMDDWNQPTTVPECLLSSMQTLNWSSYTGEPQEREIVVYILKHALHLKTATIKSSSELGVPRSEMLKELEISYRASAACQLMFDPVSISQDKRMKEDLPKGPSESTILSVASSAIANLAMNEKSQDLIMNKGGAQLLARNVSWCTFQFMRKSICKSQYGNIFEEALCWDNRGYLNDETLQRLLSRCPILEYLVVDLDEEDTIQKLTVAVPSLQNLSFYIPWSNDISGFVIDTPALKYFKLRDHNYQSHHGLIENMPYLIEAYVDCCRPDINSLIGSITSVRRLAICLETMLDEGFVFNQLEHLEVYLCKEHSPNQLFRLLKASSKLKRLHLFFMNSDLYVQADMDDWNEPSTAPECILSSLQRLSWLKYTGEPQERERLWFTF
ncbi:hypothetical protein F2Q69_00061859 [Brassica cretica]|uniref:FBD domain-containing protein n=1 Tax=Brassica cretica TaxID=69181 RepID=A0A8S9RPI4_BRACR|nr:hypothetical protein F2Q69_00061859 [Brassica cretica]